MTNYAKQYAQALSQQYPYVLRFGALYARKQEGDYKWINAHTVEVPTISVTGRTDGNRAAMESLGNWQQAHGNEWTPLTLGFHREWKDFIHPEDIDQTNAVLTIGNITRVMNEQEKFPEMDRYLISKVYADWCAAGRVPFTGTFSAATVLEWFDNMMEQMTEHNVPEMGRILYATPTAERFIKNAINLYRNAADASERVQRGISAIDNVQLEVVPSDSMKTVYDFTVGAVPGVTAKQVQMFLVHPSAIITPVNYETALLQDPSAVTKGKYVYFEESDGDVFILPHKEGGIEFFVTNLENDTATFTSAAYTGTGAVVGDCNITITAPTGDNVKKGTRYFYATHASTAPTAPAYGVSVKDNAAWTEWDGKATTVLNITNGYKATILATDADCRVYAAGNGTITSKAS